MALTKVTYSMIEGAFANVLDFGASPSASPTANTTAFQAAIDYASSLGLTIVVPEGIYLLEPSQLIAVTGNNAPINRNTALIMKSNLSMFGVGDAVLKIRDGFSSATSPIFFNMFTSNTNDENISFKNITFDMNGYNNLIAVKPVVPPPPASPGVNWGLFLCAAIVWMTNPATDEGKCDGLVIENCTFTRTPGTTLIGLAFKTIIDGVYPSEPLANNVTIRKCRFTDSGFNTSDFTPIYGWANNLLIEQCYFQVADNMDNPMTGTPIEIHGGNSTVRQCEFYGFAGGIVIADNHSQPNNNISVYSNIFECFAIPIIFFREEEPSIPTGLNGIYVYDNVIRLTSGIALNNLKIAISTDVARFYQNVFIYNNTIQNVQGNALETYGILTGSSATLESLICDKVFITGNSIAGFTKGIFSALNGTGNFIGSMIIKDNLITGAADAVSGALGQGIYIQNLPIGVSNYDYLQVTGNVIESENIAFYLEGNFAVYYADSTNVLRTISTTPYFEQNVTVVTRVGNPKRVTNDSAAPVSGSHQIGDIVYQIAPAASGFIGFVCVASGTPGTWKTFGAISA
jgi:hypothetical protein